ncbi:Reverse transcriptase domain, partial [Trinorchestia longiramus]
MHYDIPFDKTIQNVVTLLQAHSSVCIDTAKEKKLVFFTRQLELLLHKQFSMNDYCFALQSYPKCNYEYLRDFLVLPYKRKLQYITSSIDKDQSLDRTKAVDLVYLDFQKAFDKVPHERLVAKVEAHGIRGNYSRWIRNWLTGRTQRVVIHDETSDSALVTSGVRQGSVLGPLLFIIYINDLDVRIIKINKFADGTKFCHRAFTERDRATIQSDLNRFLKWTETWQMSVNIEKCS